MNINMEILAVKYMQKQIKSLSRHIKGISADEDIENLHQVRVASRRLGYALQIFASCFATPKVKFWQKELRRCRRRLGQARDRDVHIAFLHEYVQTLDKRSLRPGLYRLILRLQQERKKLQPKILKCVRRFINSKVLEDMYGQISRMEISASHVKPAPDDIQMYQKVQKHIVGCLEELMSYEESLHEPDAVIEHHKMRISVKKLRYQMEIFLPVYDDSFRSFLKIVKVWQTYLGNIHDYDIWTGLLSKFEKQEYRRTVRYFGSDRPYRRLRTGLQYFQEYCRQERERIFSEFVQNWGQITEEGFSVSLREILQNGMDRCHTQNIPGEKTLKSDISLTED